MTLDEFCQKHNIVRYGYQEREFCYRVFQDDVPKEQMWTLFHLDDYVVSSVVSGPSYILTKREK